MKNFFKVMVTFSAVWLFAAIAFAGPDQGQEESFFLGGPIRLEEVVSPTQTGQSTSGVPVTRWQQEQQRQGFRRQVTSVKPIIEGSMLRGWLISWRKASSPTIMSVSYASTTPFVLPDTVSPDEVMSKMWSDLSKRIKYESSPVALNLVKKEGVTLIYGMWYLRDTERRFVVAKNGSVTTSSPRPYEVERMHAFNEIKNMPLPMPKIPGLQVADSNIVVMDAFVVAEAKDPGIFLEVTQRKGVVMNVLVTDVDPAKPFARAGVKKGMYIVTMAGVPLVGIEREKFDAVVQSANLEQLKIEVADGPGSAPYEIVIGPSRAKEDGRLSSIAP